MKANLVRLGLDIEEWSDSGGGVNDKIHAEYRIRHATYCVCMYRITKWVLYYINDHLPLAFVCIGIR